MTLHPDNAVRHILTGTCDTEKLVNFKKWFTEKWPEPHPAFFANGSSWLIWHGMIPLFSIPKCWPVCIYTKNVFHQILEPGFWLMSLLWSVCHIFTTYIRTFLSIQLLVNNKFFHQSSFKLIKTFFISPASIYAILFIKVGGKSPGAGKVLDSADALLIDKTL